MNSKPQNINNLFSEIRQLIEEARQTGAVAVNAATPCYSEYISMLFKAAGAIYELSVIRNKTNDTENCSYRRG